MLAWRAALVAAVISILCVAAATAQDVTLTSRDGSVTVNGALIGYDGEFYRVDTIYGVLTVDGSGVVCSGPACPDLTAYVAEVRISGEAEATQILMPTLLEAFASRHGYGALRKIAADGSEAYSLIEKASGRESARFMLRTTSSSEAFADLFAQEADVAISAREANVAEVDLGRDAGVGQINSGSQSRVLALDALVPVVAPGNPVTRISLTDLARVLSAEISNWQELGGVDAPILLHLPDQQLALSAVAREIMMSDPSQTFLAKRHKSIADLVDAVAGDPFALGIATLSEPGNTKVLPLTDACGFLAVASAEGLKTEDYPLTAPMFLYLPQRRLPAVGRDFLRFLQSPAAQYSIRRAGFSDQRLTETPIRQQGNRLSNSIRAAGPEVELAVLQEMVTTLDGFSRLSVGFRFDGGSATLDAQSRSNIGLLAQAIETGLYDGRNVLLVGFSDGDGEANANRRLSLQRAASVRVELIKEAATADFSRTQLDVLGFGEAMPMACDDTDWGRRINRRVEVWVR